MSSGCCDAGVGLEPGLGYCCRGCGRVSEPGPVTAPPDGDRRWLNRAAWAASFSPDPSTKTGAALVDSAGLLASGHNRFAAGVSHDPSLYAHRPTKYGRILHCEVVAALAAYANGSGPRIPGATLYTWPFHSCSNCAAFVVEAGVRRCVAPPTPPELEERWGGSLAAAREQFEQAGVELVILGEAD